MLSEIIFENLPCLKIYDSGHVLSAPKKDANQTRLYRPSRNRLVF